MKKFWLVCWNEYRRHVFRKRFILIVLSLPFFFLLAFLVAGLSTLAMYNPNPIGYVDLSGRLKAPGATGAGSGSGFLNVKVMPYPSEEAALGDLRAERIQGYYIVPADYRFSGQVRLVAEKPLSQPAESQFREFLRANLVADQPPEIARRVMDGMKISSRLPDREQATEAPAWFQMLLPMLIGFIFILVINTSGGYLVQTVADEKENRTIEILITSLSTQQLMAGKVLGSLCVGLTQMLVWLALPLVGFFLLRGRITGLEQLRLSPDFVWVTGLALLACFVMVAGLMAGLGATATESREAQQISSLFTLPVAIPFGFLTTLINDPNSLLVRGLSFFPLTAPITLPIRVAFTRLPAWEIALNLAILFIAAGGALWLAGRAFRLGMLRYGKPVSLKELLGKH